MKGVIINYRRGRHTVYHNQAIIKILEDVKLSELVGRKVIYSNGKKKIIGIIIGKHGKKNVRAKFSRGLPGTAIGDVVEIA